MLKQHVKYNRSYTIYKNLTYFTFSALLVCLLFASSLRSMNKKAFSPHAATELMEKGKYVELKSWMDYWVKWKDKNALKWLARCADNGSAFGGYSYLRAITTIGKWRVTYIEKNTYGQFGYYQSQLLRLLVIVTYNLILYAYVHKLPGIPTQKFEVFRDKIRYWLATYFKKQHYYRPLTQLIDSAITWLNKKQYYETRNEQSWVESRSLLLEDYFWVAHCDTSMMGGLYVTDRTDKEVRCAGQVKVFLHENYKTIRPAILDGIKDIFTKKMKVTTLKELVGSKKKLQFEWVNKIIENLPKISSDCVQPHSRGSTGIFEQEPTFQSKQPGIKERVERLSDNTKSKEAYEKNKQKFEVHLNNNDPLSIYFFIRYVLNNTSVLEKYICDASLFAELAEYTMHFMYRVAVDIIMTSILCDDMTILKKFKDVFCEKIWVYYFKRNGLTAALLNESKYKDILKKVSHSNVDLCTNEYDTSKKCQPYIWVAGVNWQTADSLINYSNSLAFNEPPDQIKKSYKKWCSEYKIGMLRVRVLLYLFSTFGNFTTFKGLFESSDPLGSKSLEWLIVGWKGDCKIDN